MHARFRKLVLDHNDTIIEKSNNRTTILWIACVLLQCTTPSIHSTNDGTFLCRSTTAAVAVVIVIVIVIQRNSVLHCFNFICIVIVIDTIVNIIMSELRPMQWIDAIAA